MEGVDDDRGTRTTGQESCDSTNRAGLGGMGVEHVRPELADQGQQCPHGRNVEHGGDLTLELRQVDGMDPGVLGDGFHRSFVSGHPAGDERRLIADLVEPATQVGDVHRGTADI